MSWIDWLNRLFGFSTVSTETVPPTEDTGSPMEETLDPTEETESPMEEILDPTETIDTPKHFNKTSNLRKRHSKKRHYNAKKFTK